MIVIVPEKIANEVFEKNQVFYIPKGNKNILHTLLRK
jgi:hypothetical protein